MAYEPLTGDPLGCGGPRARLGARLAGGDAGTPPIPTRPITCSTSSAAERTGDLLVVAREGYDFRQRYEVPEHRAGHGSLTRAHMQTPVWSSEPLPAEPIRTVDLFPAMLDWLDVPAPEGIDGEPVWRPGQRLRRSGLRER